MVQVNPAFPCDVRGPRSASRTAPISIIVCEQTIEDHGKAQILGHPLLGTPGVESEDPRR